MGRPRVNLLGIEAYVLTLTRFMVRSDCVVMLPELLRITCSSKSIVSVGKSYCVVPFIRFIAP